MLDHRVAAVVAAVLAVGCGRFGFSDDVRPDGDPGEGSSAGNGTACSTKKLAVTATSAWSEYPALAWNGSKAGLMWIEDPNGAEAMQFRTVSLDGTLDPVVSLGVSGPLDTSNLAWDGAHWQMAWDDDSGKQTEVVRSLDGQPGKRVPQSTTSDDAVQMAVMPGGATAYLWNSYPTGAKTFTVYLARYDAAGGKLGPDITVATGLNSINIALVWTGSELAAFYVVGPQVSPSKLTMQRMMPDGTLIGGPITIPSLASGPISHLAVRWTGDRFFAAWSSNAGTDVQYLAPDGTRMYPTMRPPVGEFLGLGFSVAVGPDSDAAMYGNINGDTQYLVPVHRDGTFGDPIAFAGAGALSAAWVGNSWLVAASLGSVPRDISLIQLCP